jgi:hypothetical protein
MTGNFPNESSGWGDGAPLDQPHEEETGLYGWRDSRASWKERFKFLRAWLKTKTGLAAGAMAGTVVVGVLLAINSGLLYSRLSVEAPVLRWGEAVVFSIDGFDRAGRKASFDLVLMPKDYTWALGSSTELAVGGETLSEAEAITKVFSAEVREGLAHSPEIIAVGVASQEGELESEQERAERRAKAQAQLIAKSVSPLTKIWALNLGRFSVACATPNSVDTSWQRPVMLVGVRFQQSGVVLAQALENAFSGKSNIPSRECYSSFDMVLSR